MLGDLGNQAIIENSGKLNLFPRARININSLPVKEGDNPMFNRDIKSTDLYYTIKYKPFHSGKRAKVPFCINADILGVANFRFADYDDFVNKAENNKELKWIYENCEFTRELCEIAKANIMLGIPIPFNVTKYCERIGSNLLRTPEMNEMQQARFDANELRKRDTNRKKKVTKNDNIAVD